MKLKIVHVLLVCLVSCSSSSIAFADSLVDDPAFDNVSSSAPISLETGDYICTSNGKTFKMNVSGALQFTLDGVDYTQSDAVNGGNSGEIAFTGMIGRRVVIMFLKTSDFGRPPYTLRSPTADGGNTTYRCEKV